VNHSTKLPRNPEGIRPVAIR